MSFPKKNERIINSNDNQKIYVKNLPEKYSVDELTKLCSEYGKVENCNIYSDNLCQNFGIIQFSSENEAKDAIEKLNGKELDGNKIMAMLFQTKSEHKQYLQNNTKRMNERNANCNLYIKNIPLTAKDEDLSKIFSKYGNVISVRIEKSKIEKKDEKGKYDLVSKGFGYLSFDSPESARKAKEDLNGKYLPGFEGWNRTLNIEFFLTKYERQFRKSRCYYANYFMNKNNNNLNTPMNYMGPYQYPFPYPYSYPLPANQRYTPMAFNQFNTL